MDLNNIVLYMMLLIVQDILLSSIYYVGNVEFPNGNLDPIHIIIDLKDFLYESIFNYIKSDFILTQYCVYKTKTTR